MSEPRFDLGALAGLVANATPGPWETAEPGVGGPRLYVQQQREMMLGTPVCNTKSSGMNKHASEDAAYIAGFNPEVGAALVQAVQAAQEAVEIIEDCWGQFAIELTSGPRKGELVSGGLSTLEWVEEALPRLREALAPFRAVPPAGSSE